MYWSIFLLFILFPSLLNSGIISGAVVKTEKGDIPIQDLKVGGSVIACNDNSIQFNAHIMKISKTSLDCAVCLDLGLGEFHISEQQSVYDAEIREWTAACFLNDSSKLIDYRVEERELCELCNESGSFEAYELEFDQECYFYIGPDHVMVEGIKYEKE